MKIENHDHKRQEAGDIVGKEKDPSITSYLVASNIIMQTKKTRRRSCVNNKSLLSILSTSFFSLLLSVPFVDSAKQLVMFAGPHQAGASSVEKFYHNYASGYNNAKTSQSLDGWIWPRVQGDLNQGHDLERHKIFNFLVTHPDDENIQNQLNEAIHKAWDEAQEGVIVGSEEFDRVTVDDDLTSGYNGLKRMREITNRLHVDQQDVWVVLNYRSPRIDQWISFWKHNSDSHYRGWLCSNYANRWEILETAMNPLGIAKTIREQTGWNVVLIDLIGAQDEGFDASHIIACEILGNTDCRNGFVSDRYNKTFHLNSVQKEIGNIGEDNIEELEIFFRQRDCSYKESLEDDDGFYVLHQSTLWQGCNQEHIDIYKRLTNSTILLDLIQNQKGCNDLKGYQPETFLVGDFNDLTQKKEVEKMKQNDASSKFENLQDVEKDEVKAEKSKKGNQNLEVEKQHSIIGPALFLTLIGVGVQKYLAHRKKSNRHHLWDRENYNPREFALDAEYGVDDGYSDQIFGNNSYEDPNQEELEMSISKNPDLRYEDSEHRNEVHRQVKTNKSLMQMPRRISPTEGTVRVNAPSYDYDYDYDLTWALGEPDSSDDEDYKDE